MLEKNPYSQNIKPASHLQKNKFHCTLNPSQETRLTCGIVLTFHKDGKGSKTYDTGTVHFQVSAGLQLCRWMGPLSKAAAGL